MSEPLSDLFSYYGRRPNQFFLKELEEMLCPPHNDKSGARKTPLQMDTSRRISQPPYSAEYSLEKTPDGSSIHLHVLIQVADQSFMTAMRAEKVRGDDLYEIKSLVFDNKTEKLKHRWEITSVLGFIGRNHLEKICEGKAPRPHEERGQFGKFGRFMNRCLPNNPMDMWHPPY